MVLKRHLVSVLTMSPCNSSLLDLFLDSQWESFKLFGLIYYVYSKKFELF